MSLLGEGGVGRVIEDEEGDAIKYFDKVNFTSWVHEICLRAILGKEIGLCRTIGMGSGDQGLYISMESYEYDLRNYMVECRYDFSSFLLRELLPKVIGQLRAMHRMGFAHGDVKPMNILITTYCDGHHDIALTDLGSSMFLGVPCDLALTTPEFIPPKLDPKQPLAPGYDYYSLGVSLQCMSFKRSPEVKKIQDYLLHVDPRSWEVEVPEIYCFEYPLPDRTPFVGSYQEELVPEIIRKYHTDGKPELRLSGLLYLCASQSLPTLPMLEWACLLVTNCLLGYFPLDVIEEAGNEKVQGQIIVTFLSLLLDEKAMQIVRSYAEGRAIRLRNANNTE